MNMALTLGVYAEICRETGAPFIFPGSQTQWDGLTDVTDADLLGEQMLWAATHSSGQNQAFNITNGDVFRWLRPQIAEMFGVEPEGYDGAPRPLDDRMDRAPEVWRTIAERHGLAEPDVTRFLGFRSTPDSFADKIARYRKANILPAR